MNCLVTGAAGFLGTALVQELCKMGHFVVGIDNFSSGLEHNVKKLSEFDNFKFYEKDICTVEKTFGREHGRFDVVFNLACPASPKFYYALAQETLLACSLGVINMVALAKENGAKFIQASTSEVYGEPAVHPQVETYFGNVDSVGPRSCYDEGKRFAEAFIMAQVKDHGLKATILRIFNTYGPNMRPDDGRVVTNFITAALVGQDICLYGDGSQTRSFCYQSDTVLAFVSAWLDCSYTGPINVGSDQEISVLELATKIKYLTNSQSKIITMPALVQDPSRRRADTTLAKKYLNWSPKVNSLDQGLQMTIQGLLQ